jgi:hypothetical protein
MRQVESILQSDNQIYMYRSEIRGGGNIEFGNIIAIFDIRGGRKIESSDKTVGNFKLISPDSINEGQNHIKYSNVLAR